MNCRRRNLNLSVPALVALAALSLGGASFAASVFGVAQPGWENDPDAEPSIYTDSIFDGSSFNSYVISNRDHSPETVVLQILQIDLTERNRGSLLGNDPTTNSWGDFDSSASGGFSSQMAQSDLQAAIAWLSSMSDLGNSGARNEALPSLIETWTGTPDTGGYPLEFIDADRYRDRGDGRRGSRDLIPARDLTVVPEPSTAFLGVLGAFFATSPSRYVILGWPFPSFRGRVSPKPQTPSRRGFSRNA